MHVCIHVLMISILYYIIIVLKYYEFLRIPGSSLVAIYISCKLSLL